MTTIPEPTEGPHPLPVVTVAPRGRPLLAWVVILLAVLGVLAARWLMPAKGEAKGGASSLVTEMQGRYLVGVHELLPAENKDLARQAAALNGGPVKQRLRYVILVGELDGPDKALEQLDRLESGRRQVYEVGRQATVHCPAPNLRGLRSRRNERPVHR